MDNGITIRGLGRALEINGEVELDKESRLRRNVNELMSYCTILNKRDLDALKFKEIVLNTAGKNDADGYELMEIFSSLDKSLKIDIVSQCTKDSSSLDVSNDFWLQLHEERNFKTDTVGNYIEYTEAELKNRIKYCKNPMEKQKLQRELSNMNFMSGKHRKGKRKHG